MSDGRPVALVLRALYLGDMLTGLPALRLLRDALPAHRIVLAAPTGVGSLAVRAGVVDDVLDALELAPLRGAPPRPDIGIDLHGNGPHSRDLLAAVRPARLVAYYGGPHVWSPTEHEVSRWCRLVDEAFGTPPPWPGVRGLLPVPDVAAPFGLTVVHPGAKAAARCWPAERYAQVARRLREAGHEVVITGGPAEKDLARAVAAAAGTGVRTDLPLDGLLRAVAGARVVVCGDTGIAHVASAYGTPSVVLFGPVPPAQWGPPADGPHRALWHGVGRGDPHGARPDAALLQITVEEVVRAVGEVVRKDSRRDDGGNPSIATSLTAAVAPTAPIGR